MKKYIILLFSFCFLSFSFAYTPSSKDTQILNSFYTKLDKVFETNKTKIEKINTKISSLKTKFQKNEKSYYFLSEIEKHINWLSTTWTQTLQWPYKVLQIIDGDNIQIEVNWTWANLRLLWVDAPEKEWSQYLYNECAGEEAITYAKAKLEWKDIYLEVDPSQWGTDDKDRLLGYVFVDWNNWNLELIQNWYWLEYTYSTPYKYQNNFKDAQNIAKENKSWLWKNLTCVNIIDTYNMSGFTLTWDLLSWSSLTWNTSTSSNNYTCEEKTYCEQMTTCQEATYYLDKCWITRLDADSDWIPCESLCQ